MTAKTTKQQNKRQPDPKGVYDRYVPGQTKCRICHYPMMVNGTETSKMDDGRLLVTRQMKCLGPDNHKYPLKEPVTLQTPPEKAANAADTTPEKAKSVKKRPPAAPSMN